MRTSEANVTTAWLLRAFALLLWIGSAGAATIHEAKHGQHDDHGEGVPCAISMLAERLDDARTPDVLAIVRPSLQAWCAAVLPGSPLDSDLTSYALARAPPFCA